MGEPSPGRDLRTTSGVQNLKKPDALSRPLPSLTKTPPEVVRGSGKQAVAGLGKNASASCLLRQHGDAELSNALECVKGSEFATKGRRSMLTSVCGTLHA